MPLVDPVQLLKDPASAIGGIIDKVNGLNGQILDAASQSPQGKVLSGLDSSDPITQLIQTLVRNGDTQLAANIKAALERGDYRAIQGLMAAGNSNWTKEWSGMETYLNNMIANQNTIEARNYETDVAKNSTMWLGDQLEQLGLSPSGVLGMGINSVNGVGSAQNQLTNNSFRRSQLEYQQKMGLARQMLSMTSSMASAGIYGSALRGARKASGIISSKAAHSGLEMARNKPKHSYQYNLKQLEGGNVLSNGNEPGLADDEWWF